MKILRTFWIDDGTTSGVEVNSIREMHNGWTKADEAYALQRDLKTQSFLVFKNTNGDPVVVNSARVASVRVSEVPK
jgi:hypothetical protein